MKRIVTYILAMLLCIVGLAGCSTASNGSASASDKILFCLSSSSDVFLGTLVNGAQEYANTNQIELTVEDGQSSIETQVSQIKNAKAQGYTAIICNMIDTDTALQIMAAADGLPIVFINRSPKEKLLKENQYIYVGSDESISGALQAEYLANYFKEKGLTSVNAVLMEGEKGHPGATSRTEAVKAGLKEAGIDVTYVFDDTADWSQDKAKSMFQTFLKTKCDFDCIISNNDTMALGVIEACKEKGIDLTDIPVVGIDGIQDACIAIQNKIMNFTVLQSATGQGKAAIEAAVALSNDKSIDNIEYASENKYIWVPFEGISSDNVSSYLN
ncbi:monosaccharide ABC transporter substrate-binding protein (CUT2 family) [Lachnotalea glycerini]|uniref:Monosaccharide ABC transporter substrate-binding protein (CUT2 family) n=1 Tax=Lachnotalea glycerini TaxID=1763509 RepID=A0A318ESM6_9FIRM|nr:substrate-binding domain-containing protein [Lachnotalea glycerini]PXV90332.1 monosaccharide ABC transporter substrate-binding protein (CUT2 family) [Lachnotalea glycerini]